MKKRKGIVAVVVVLLLVTAGVVTAKIIKPRVDKNDVTSIEIITEKGDTIEIIDKGKIDEIIKYVNSKSYIPAIFIPKCIDNFKVAFYDEDKVCYYYYTYGYEIMHANGKVYWSKPETVEKIKELAGIK